MTDATCKQVPAFKHGVRSFNLSETGLRFYNPFLQPLGRVFAYHANQVFLIFFSPFKTIHLRRKIIHFKKLHHQNYTIFTSYKETMNLQMIAENKIVEYLDQIDTIQRQHVCRKTGIFNPFTFKCSLLKEGIHDCCEIVFGSLLLYFKYTNSDIKIQRR